ncbi:MAG: FtsX-like permease family protein [Prevotella sp.]|nr:FtsX-like permease family protein [Prevotella sp.]
MNFPFYIARRYLFSKKSTNAINVISGISVVGVAVASMALVVTLSVFNGFHDMVASFFTQLDPQLKITPAKGKTAASNDSTLMRIRQLDEVAVATDVLEDQALAVYGDRQQMVTIKGVDDNYDKLTHIRQILEGDGDYALHAADMNYGILGLGVAYQLGIGYTYREPLKIYAPRREGQINMANLQDGFVEDELYSPGVLFSIKQGKYDKRYIITAIQFTRNLFDRDGELTSLELRLKPGSNFERVKAKVQEMAGTRFVVRDRYEQQEDTFRIMKVEKLMAYIFLTFILVIACFNIIGSLSMLMIDKRNDVVTLRNLGASDRQIIRIFLFEGRMISAIGAVTGIAIGLLLCLLQQQFGLIGLGSTEGSFVVDAYPVSVHPWDIVVVFFTVLAVGFISVWYPVHYFAKRLLN